MVVVCSMPFLAGAMWCGWNVYHHSVERALVKDDFGAANNIRYGLLSVDEWENKIREIIIYQIEDFDLNQRQDSLLSEQISQTLHGVITQADTLIQRNDETFKQKVRKVLVNTLVDRENLRRQVPVFTDRIVAELTKPESKERFKALAKDKFDEYAARTFGDIDSARLHSMFSRYGVNDREALNAKTVEIEDRLQRTTYTYAFAMLAMLAFFLLLWIVVYRYPELRKPFFVVSVMLALVVLLVGLATPMIEIDARLTKVGFVLMGQQQEFSTQMLFYRSKSILQVVHILLQSGRIDSVLVGVLILAFSVLFPITKLISTEVYLLGKEGVKNNRFIYFFAFRSGKWSMADVMVVAIFMSYVGFDGILDGQLKTLNIETDAFSSITTNLTALQPGFVLFTAYVVYGLILSEILKRITKKSAERAARLSGNA